MTHPKPLQDWTVLGEKRLDKIIKKARTIPGLGKQGRVERVELKMVGAAMMTKLNREYRGKAYPTDVLSFPSPLPIRRLGFPGELVICVPTLKRQAKEQGHSAETELDVLLVHGFLHLLGFDHEKSPREAARMARAEKKLLGRLGLIQRTQSGKA